MKTKLLRIGLFFCFLWALLHILFGVVAMALPNSHWDWQLVSTELSISSFAIPHGGDLTTYITAAQDLIAHQPVYQLAPWTDDGINYRYHPVFAYAISFLVRAVPADMLETLMFVLNIAGYVIGSHLWAWHVIPEITHQKYRWLAFGLMMASSAWYANLVYGNINSMLVATTALAVLLLWRGKYGLATPFLLFAILTKPQWVVAPLVIPFVTGDWKAVLRLGLYLVAGYLIVTALFLAGTGTYGLQVLRDYATFATRADGLYPYAGPGAFTVENGVTQTLIRYGMPTPTALVVSRVIRLGFVPELWLAFALWARKRLQGGLILLLMLSAYLVAMLSVGEMQELFLAPLIVSVLLSQFSHYGFTRPIVAWVMLYIWFSLWFYLAYFTGNESFDLVRSTPMTISSLLLLLTSIFVILYREVRAQHAQGVQVGYATHVSA